jgi:hypothetical protein
MPSGSPLTRRKLLTALTGAGALPNTLPSQERQQKALLVVAHPDDEYAFAATAYRFVRELGGVAGQIVITNGEGGYRYSALAESIYGVSLTKESEGRARLPGAAGFDAGGLGHGVRPDTVQPERQGPGPQSVGLSVVLAGGAKKGVAVGVTDSIGLRAVENLINPHDLHATIMVGGHVVKEAIT